MSFNFVDSVAVTHEDTVDLQCHAVDAYKSKTQNKRTEAKIDVNRSGNEKSNSNIAESS